MKKQDNVIIGIYKITNPKDKVYIGQSTNVKRRKSQYYCFNSSSIGYKIKNSLKKYGPENHIFEIIEECTLEQLNEREIYWIKYYNSVKRGLNISEGGGGGNMTEYVKSKISKTWKSKSKDELEIINKKRSQGNLGKKKPGSGCKYFSKDHIQKIRNKQKGISKVKNFKAILMLDKYTQNLIREFESIGEAAAFIKVKQPTLSSCLTGHSKTCGGYVWKYKILPQENLEA
jgi:group I intron endonuclease